MPALAIIHQHAHQGKQKGSMGPFITMWILINNENISETSNMVVDLEDVALAATHMQSSPGRAAAVDERRWTKQYGKGSISAAIWTFNGYERWMQSNAVMKKGIMECRFHGYLTRCQQERWTISRGYG